MISPKKLAAIETRAAEGDSEAMYDIAQRALGGHGVPQDLARARDLVERAAATGHAKSLYLLGVWYQTGEFEAENPIRAAECYQKAGEAGHGRAWLNLGILRQVGLGSNVDIVAAAEAYRNGAEAGSGHAAANLGNLYETGALTDGEPAYETAAAWYKTAIRLGYAEARGALDNLFTATGIPAVMSDVPRAKSGVLWKRILGLQ